MAGTAKPRKSRPGNDTRSREEIRREHKEQRERQRRRKRLLIELLLIALVVAVGIVLSLTVFFHISNVTVTGQTQYAKDRIVAASGINTGDNLFLVKKEKVQERILEELPFTGTVNVKRSFPNTIVLEVQDADITTAVQYRNNYFLLGKDGKVLARAQDSGDMNRIIVEQAKKRQDLAAAQKAKEAAQKTTTKKATTKVATTSAASTTKAGTAKTTGATSSTKATGASATATTRATGTTTPTTANVPTTAVRRNAAMIYAAFAAPPVSSSTTTTTAAVTTTSPTTPGQAAPASNKKALLSPAEAKKAINKVTVLRGLKIQSADVGRKIQLKNDNTWQVYEEIRKAMKKAGLDDITAADLTHLSTISLMYQNRIRIYLGSAAELERKIELCKKVLDEQNAISREQIGTINVSIDGRAYYSAGGVTTASYDTKTVRETTTLTTTTRSTTRSVTSGVETPSGAAAAPKNPDTAAPATTARPASTTRKVKTPPVTATVPAASGTNRKVMNSQSW
ncbi:MAG: FtsQ-type POTRA domain-containing protein [Clostridia bacterium]|nr:FtsQ-type POTRA domain-containing protein [Clostridia bacterium]